MKPITALFVTSLWVAPVAAAQQPAVGNDAVAELRQGFGQVSGWILKAAEDVPADKYAYQPVATVRTFGQLIGHVVDEYNYYCTIAGGRNVEWVDTVEKGPADKATLVAKLRQATAACTTAYGGSPRPRPLIRNNADAALHYGNIATYLRMMGMVPPSSQ